MMESYQQPHKKKLSCIVTTSWDDGSVLDLKLAKLLDKYGLKGTFYVPKHYLQNSVSECDLLDIAERHEIGAHGINHTNLTQLTTAEAVKEIMESKRYLEFILKQKVLMFAYPLGAYNEAVKECVKKCGFSGARTISPFDLSPDFDRFEMGVTLHAYPFPVGRKETWNYPFSRTLFQPMMYAYNNILRLRLSVKSFYSLKNLTKELVTLVISQGGIFHLWGHSWEIEQFKMWKSLEEIFEFIARQPHITYLTNSDCLLLDKLSICPNDGASNENFVCQ